MAFTLLLPSDFVCVDFHSQDHDGSHIEQGNGARVVELLPPRRLVDERVTAKASQS